MLLLVRSRLTARRRPFARLAAAVAVAVFSASGGACTAESNGERDADGDGRGAGDSTTITAVTGETRSRSGGNGDGTAASDRLLACDLLDETTAGSILGGPVADPIATEGKGTDELAGRSGCAWATTDGASATLIELVRTDDMSDAVRRTGFSASARFTAARSQHPDVPIDGVGTRSFWVEEAATLHLLTGRTYVVVEVAVADPARSRSIATAIADVAVSRVAAADRQTGSDVNDGGGDSTRAPGGPDDE